MTCLPATPASETAGPCGLWGEVSVLTERSGAVRLADLAIAPEPVLSRSGWTMPVVRPAGRGLAVLVTFVPGRRGRGDLPVRCNSGHRVHAVCSPDQPWPLLDGSWGPARAGAAVLPAAAPPIAPGDPDHDRGFLHGLVFGDGWLAYRASGATASYQIQLCGAKAALHGHRFDRLTRPPSRNGDAVATVRSVTDLKAPPGGGGAAYLAGFLEGWLAADGCEVGGAHVLSSTEPAAVAWAIRHAPLSGRFVTGHVADPSAVTNYGRRGAQLHRLRLRAGIPCWIVESVRPYLAEAELFAAAADGGLSLAGGVLIGRSLTRG